MVYDVNKFQQIERCLIMRKGMAVQLSGLSKMLVAVKFIRLSFQFMKLNK